LTGGNVRVAFTSLYDINNVLTAFPCDTLVMPRLHDVIARRALKLDRRQWKQHLAPIWTSSL